MLYVVVSRASDPHPQVEDVGDAAMVADDELPVPVRVDDQDDKDSKSRTRCRRSD